MSEEQMEQRDDSTRTAHPQIVMDIARELYDRFLMGGWTPEDVYSWLEGKLGFTTTPAQTAPQGEAPQRCLNCNMPKSDHRELDNHCPKGHWGWADTVFATEHYTPLSEAPPTGVPQEAPDDGSCDFCGSIPTLQKTLCRECFENRGTRPAPPEGWEERAAYTIHDRSCGYIHDQAQNRCIDEIKGIAAIIRSEYERKLSGMEAKETGER